MALTKDSTGYYLEPTTGQYYSPYTAPRSTGYNPYPFAGVFNQMPLGDFGRNPFLAGSMGGRSAPEGLMSFDGKQYVPFTGSSAGISQGKRSVVDAMIGNRQPYQYNVPSLASMFPSLQGQMQGQMPMQGDSGAGRFMGGLLGSMPTPVSSTTTQAPSTSGAGRFL
jgi:hypothetical protein